MKLKGEFVIREVAGETVVIPVGETALQLGGMVLLNQVSRVLWEQLQQGADLQSLVTAVTDQFDTTPQQAQPDIEEFLENLRKANLLEE